MKEGDLQRLIMIRLSELNCMIMRNNTGFFLTLDGKRKVQAGLGAGSSDLIGLTPDGRFIAPEIKTKTGRPTAQQLRFISAVKDHNGLAGIVRSIEEAEALLRGEL